MIWSDYKSPCDKMIYYGIYKVPDKKYLLHEIREQTYNS